MFYEIIKIVVPYYSDGDFIGTIRYKIKTNGGGSLPLTFETEDKAIEYVDHLIHKAGER